MSAILVNGINSGAIAQGDGAVAVATEKGNIDMERGATIAQEHGSGKFKVGDIVQLISGSPLLTVVYVRGDQVKCKWFSAKSKEEDTFPEICLDHAKAAWRKPALNGEDAQ